MIVILCLDDQGGMMFHQRRQSRDKEVIRDILEMKKDRILWMNAYSAKLFEGAKEQICCEKDFLKKAGKGDFCFVENEPIGGYQEQIEQLIVYRWNRRYPADFFPDLDFHIWVLTDRKEFQGNSHEKLTKEVYDRKDD